jgi:hypothetical protein
MLTPITRTPYKLINEDLPGTSLQVRHSFVVKQPAALYITTAFLLQTVDAPCLIVDPQNQLKHG